MSHQEEEAKEQHHGCGCGASHDHHDHEEEDDDSLYAQHLEGLITEDGDDITPALHAALTEIFNRFDREKKGAWTLDGDLQRFAKKTQNGRKFSPGSIKAIKANYALSEDGTSLTKNGFFQMYIVSTMADPEETWKDMAIFGYDDELKLKQPISQAEMDEEIPTDTEAVESSSEDELSFDSEGEGDDKGGQIDMSQFNEEKLKKALEAAQFSKPE